MGSGKFSNLLVRQARRLVVFDANPLEDIRNTNSVRYVMQNGSDNFFCRRMLETLRQ